MLNMIRDIVSAGESFAYETHPAGGSSIARFQHGGLREKLSGSTSTAFRQKKANERVGQREREGGHKEPKAVIRRRRKRVGEKSTIVSEERRQVFSITVLPALPFMARAEATQCYREATK